VAVEFRHPSWQGEETFALLAAHHAASCVMSGARLPCLLRATTDRACVRMHGPGRDRLYAGSCSDADLSWWADRAREWDRAGQDVFASVTNDGDANAVRHARALQAVLGPGSRRPRHHGRGRSIHPASGRRLPPAMTRHRPSRHDRAFRQRNDHQGRG
jgi:uncharacterized protein YecE (DUF72 family)